MTEISASVNTVWVMRSKLTKQEYLQYHSFKNMAHFFSKVLLTTTALQQELSLSLMKSDGMT